MFDVFISYSKNDEQLAEWLHRSCQNFNINSFLAPISLKAGAKWKQEILNNLKNSKWFFFLATPNSINSDPVKHEIGGALVLNKNIIPILYNLEFHQLPDWIKEYQGIKVTNNDVSHIKETLEDISKKIKVDKVVTGIIIGVFIGVLLFLSSKE